MGTAITFITLAIQAAQVALDLTPIAQLVYDAVTKAGGPTLADFAALHDIDKLNRERLNKDPAAVTA